MAVAGMGAMARYSRTAASTRSPALGQQALLVVGVPPAPFHHEHPDAGQGLVLPVGAHLGRVAVAAGVIGGGVVGQAVGDGLDERGAASFPGPLDRRGDAVPHGHDVVAVDLLAVDAGRNGLLGQRHRRGLGRPGHRDGPLVVVDDEHDRQPADAGQVERLGDVALGGRPVAQDAHGDTGLTTELEGHRHPCRVRRLGTHRDRDGEVLTGSGEVAAPLVATPVQEQLHHGDASPQLRALLPERRHQHVGLRHGRGHADGHGLLAQRRRERAQLAAALQGDRPGVEGPGECHGPVQPGDGGPVGPGRQGAVGSAVRGDVAGGMDLEHRHDPIRSHEPIVGPSL